MPWFGARTVYQYERDLPVARARGTFVYEERVIILEAADMESAIPPADVEAYAYAERQRCIHSGHVDIFHMYEPPGDLMEVYSFMRETELTPQEYLQHFAIAERERTTSLQALRRVQWYCARSLINFQHDAKYPGETMIEERLVLVQLGSPEAARAQAETEARGYAEAQNGVSLGVTALYRIPAERPGHLDEVFSQLRVSALDENAYFDTYIQTGRENFGDND